VKRTDAPPATDNRIGVSLPPTDFARRRKFEAIAEFFEGLHRAPFTISQAVSIARALRPYAAQEARRRLAHGSTAPGRRSSAVISTRFNSREFISRCVGLSPATLRKAEMVVAAAERDSRLRPFVMVMDETGRPGLGFRLITGERDARFPIQGQEPPADRKFGERLLMHLLAAARVAWKDVERPGTQKGKRPRAKARP
jgi:hypothetical protein